MNKSFFEDKSYPIGSNFEDYASSVSLKDDFRGLGLSKSSSIIPNIAQGIPSLAYVSKINQVQMLNDKLKALEMKNKSDSEYLDHYLSNNNEKIKQMPRLTPVRQNPTQYSTAIESLPQIDNSNYMHHSISRPQRTKNLKPMSNYQLQSFDPKILNDDNVNQSTNQPRINPQMISQLKGDLFKTRDNIHKMKNNLKNIKSIMFDKMEEMEEKQNVTLEKLRNVIMIAKKNAEKGKPLGISSGNNNSNLLSKNQMQSKQRATMPKRSVHNSNYSNDNNNRSKLQASLNFNESGFFSQIAKIIDQKLLEHDRRKQREINSCSQSQCNYLPPIRKKHHQR